MGPLFFFPWITYLFPEWSGWNNFLRVFQTTYDFLQKTVDEHQETPNFENPRDLIDVYLKEISATKDPASSFYKDDGGDGII